MTKPIKHISDNTLLAMYLALRAARNGAQRIYITNDALKAHLRTQRVHKPRIHNFAKTLEPIFPRHAIGKEQYKLKNGLFLYFTDGSGAQQSNTDIRTERIVRIPNQKEVDDAFSVQALELPKLKS